MRQSSFDWRSNIYRDFAQHAKHVSPHEIVCGLDPRLVFLCVRGGRRGTEMNEWVANRSISAVPLNALRAFEIAARHMSLKAAALELNVTPSAISHRLRLLEKVLGSRLLRRVGGKLELTECGERLAPALTAGFAQIMNAVRDVRPQKKL